MLCTSLLFVFAALVAGDVTITVSDVEPRPYDFSRAVSSPTELLNASCPEELAATNPYQPQVLLSSFSNTDDDFPTDLFASSDGLVRGALEAWGQHQHLILRPDEIWFEILAQLNMYMAVHAEDLRSLFVDHEGRETIEVWENTWYNVVAAFADEIQQRVRTDWLQEWIMPGFSTSTPNDELTATVLMMGLMQHYFEFAGGIICGLPRVTLLGEREDWVRLVDKLEHLGDFGEEPTAYARNLRPILRRFVQTFDEPTSEETRSFWTQIVRAERRFSCGAGPVEYNVSGWITGFLHWRTDGSLRVPAGYEDDRANALDGVAYAPLPLEDVPAGYAKVPLRMMDYPAAGEETTAYLLAGNVAVRRTAGGGREGGFVNAAPASAWFMYAPVDANYITGPGMGSAGELRGLAEGFGTCRAGYGLGVL
ncbi:hypothetical protein S40293_04985 [Stachybotrys chartarum IBT 40293]|nr:hypothetical protein S40293_04985 [Stachybotrys chartarum IBT 40293]